MILNFFGNGSGFSDSHTNAWFTTNDSIIFIDLSMLNLQKALGLHPENFDNIYICLTHMHDDHSSGISLFIQHMFYRFERYVKVIVPYNLLKDVLTEFKIKGLDKRSYILFDTKKTNITWLKQAILTSHDPNLKRKCYGYVFEINNKIVVYSGDTSTLKPYIKHLKNASEFYIDVSIEYGQIHLMLNDDTLTLLNKISKNIDIYLMHIDNIKKAKSIIKNTNLKIVEI